MIRVMKSETLAGELEDHLAQWSARTGITVETWALPASDVPARVSRGVLAVVREALANVERHSGASTASIAVTAGRGGLRLTVSDNGTGAVPECAGHGMRAAFAELGGTLSVHGVPGEGTTVTGTLRRW
ncbi:two-component system, NarL family, sensor histidine kinase UhpB [Nonomuraea solani]|uniref:Two-component system, NarL family, sensor histidine kinase UhpB n=1 Tax=Nonomuraea solani TaxID=1144553 RepID=A0A1H6EWR0_9ACTN|nr:ATP-binding protein [Nonomuraea solani]SEH01365.1 two-component system, NarL family, sensor histidine kinase UhpB [Nonomuraea solani]